MVVSAHSSGEIALLRFRLDLTWQERFAAPRNAVFHLIGSSQNFNMEVLKGAFLPLCVMLSVFYQIFQEEADITKHGPVVWALMMKGTVPLRNSFYQ